MNSPFLALTETHVQVKECQTGITCMFLQIRDLTQRTLEQGSCESLIKIRWVFASSEWSNSIPGYVVNIPFIVKVVYVVEVD